MNSAFPETLFNVSFKDFRSAHLFANLLLHRSVPCCSVPCPDSGRCSLDFDSINVVRLCLCLYFPQEGGGDVCGGNGAESGEGDAYALLATGTHYAAAHATEGAPGDFYFLVALEGVVAFTEQHEVLVVRLRGEDEVVHLVGGNGEGWVLAVMLVEMVVVVGEERDVVDAGCSICRGEICEDEVGQDVAQHFLSAAVNLFHLPAPGYVGVDAAVGKAVGGDVFASVAGTEEMPLAFARCVGGISYRHPCEPAFGFGEGCGGKPRA